MKLHSNSSVSASTGVARPLMRSAESGFSLELKANRMSRVTSDDSATATTISPLAGTAASKFSSTAGRSQSHMLLLPVPGRSYNPPGSTGVAGVGGGGGGGGGGQDSLSSLRRLGSSSMIQETSTAEQRKRFHSQRSTSLPALPPADPSEVQRFRAFVSSAGVAPKKPSSVASTGVATSLRGSLKPFSLSSTHTSLAGGNMAATVSAGAAIVGGSGSSTPGSVSSLARPYPSPTSNSSTPSTSQGGGPSPSQTVSPTPVLASLASRPPAPGASVTASVAAPAGSGRAGVGGSPGFSSSSGAGQGASSSSPGTGLGTGDASQTSIPISALRKAEEYSRVCAKQGIVPISLDAAARIITKQNFSKALTGDRQITAWCTAGLFDNQSELVLKDCHIGEDGTQAIASKLQSSLEKLDLSSNSVGPRGALALAESLCRLQALNLSKNAMNDAAVQALCTGLQKDTAPRLVRLALSENQIARGGLSLGQMLPSQLSLEFIDLHWNYISSDAAHGLFTGLEQHHKLGGALARMDISWNCLGQGRTPGKGGMAALAKVLKVPSPLIHLDLSYNSLKEEDCAAMGEGLRDNHTLVGLHLVGNSAAVDSDGFVIPSMVKTAEDQGMGPRPIAPAPENLAQSDAPMPPRLVSGEELRTLREASRRLLRGSLSGEEIANGVQDVLEELGLAEVGQEDVVTAIEILVQSETCTEDRLVEAWESAVLKVRAKEWERRRAERLAMDRDRSFLEARTSCWICESWQSVEISHVGPANGVWLFTSLDNYDKATPLTKDGDKWSCIRMLPPEQVCLILQVDNKLSFIDGMETAQLKDPQIVRLRQSEALAPAPEGAVPLREVSVLYLGCKHRKKPANNKNGISTAPVQRAVVVNDPDDPSGFLVRPRITETEFKAKKQKPLWCFEKSIFAAWRFESAKTYGACFGNDWQHAKVAKFLKDHTDQTSASKVLNNLYGKFIRLYRRCSASSTDSGSTPGVSMNACAELLSSAKVIDDQYCRLADIDTMFIAARVREKGADKRPFAVKAGDTLLRFQFLEFLLRAALARYLKTKEVETPSEALEKLFQALEPVMSPVVNDLANFLSELHCEECDDILRANEQMLTVVYRMNSGRWCKPGEERLMCCREFEAVLYGGEVFTDSFPTRDITYAFAMGMQLYADELYSLEFCQMTFLEFIHGLAAVAFLKREPEPLAERLNRLMISLSAWVKVGCPPKVSQK